MEGKKTYFVSIVITIVSVIAVVLDQALQLSDSLKLSVTQVALITSALSAAQAILRAATKTPPTDSGLLAYAPQFATMICAILIAFMLSTKGCQPTTVVNTVVNDVQADAQEVVDVSE